MRHEESTVVTNGKDAILRLMDDMTDQSAPVLQRTLPFDPAPKALPGIAPLAPDDWLTVDDAFAGQMAVRDHLLETRLDAVLAMHETARPAAEELLDLLRRLPERGYDVTSDSVMRPDGVTVPINRTHPMQTLGHLVQEDLCILEKHGDEHVLTAAVLCFPASWRLDEKFMRPLTVIHDPVTEYGADLARRVQRLFDGVRSGRPLWRFNYLPYDDATLFQPRSIHDRRERTGPNPPYIRSEKQAVMRLPETHAVLFSIHTFVLAAGDAPTP